MPFDDTPTGGEGGGGDPRHEKIPDIVAKGLQDIVRTLMREKTCGPCASAEIAIMAFSSHIKACESMKGTDYVAAEVAHIMEAVIQSCGIEDAVQLRRKQR